LVVERPIHAAGAARERRADGIVIGPSFPTILRAAQSGERDAIETIYRDVAPLVIGYLRANGARDPEDVASDVFVSMVTRFDTFNGDEAHFRSWLLTITYRRLVDDFRRRGRRPELPVSSDDLSENLASEVGDSESDAMSRLRSRGVIEALDQLTTDQRSAFTLRVLADLPIAGISDIMGKPETAVKALLRRAFASMSRTVAQQEEVSDV
jgi:RNA polymerase sigma-70 factor (ECF subfamily)